jgi:hypothetical protein
MAGTVGGAFSGSNAVNGGGFSGPTHEVSGLLGLLRNDVKTCWAHGEEGITECPIPGMLMSVAFDSPAATDWAKSSDATVSKLPEMSSVGMLLMSG